MTLDCYEKRCKETVQSRVISRLLDYYFIYQGRCGGNAAALPFFLAAGISLLTKFALNFVSSVLIWLHGVLSPEINTPKEGSHEKA